LSTRCRHGACRLGVGEWDIEYREFWSGLEYSVLQRTNQVNSCKHPQPPRCMVPKPSALHKTFPGDTPFRSSGTLDVAELSPLLAFPGNPCSEGSNFAHYPETRRPCIKSSSIQVSFPKGRSLPLEEREFANSLKPGNACKCGIAFAVIHFDYRS